MEYDVLELPPRKDRIDSTRTTRLVHWGWGNMGGMGEVGAMGAMGETGETSSMGEMGEMGGGEHYLEGVHGVRYAHAARQRAQDCLPVLFVRRVRLAASQCRGAGAAGACWIQPQWHERGQKVG